LEFDWVVALGIGKAILKAPQMAFWKDLSTAQHLELL
jgi:hypothetical protein